MALLSIYFSQCCASKRKETKRDLLSVPSLQEDVKSSTVMRHTVALRRPPSKNISLAMLASPSFGRPVHFGLATNVKDEPRLREWLVYHRLIGFEHILVFDNESGGNLAAELSDLPFVRVIRAVGSKVKRWTTIDAVLYFRGRADWMLYLDADEVFVPQGEMNVSSFIESFGDGVGQVSVPWLPFGSSWRIKSPPGSLLLAYQRRHGLVAKTVKSFVRLEAMRHLPNDPHHFRISNKWKWIFASGEQTKVHILSPEQRESYPSSGAFIAHFMSQSWEDLWLRKGSRRDDFFGSRRPLHVLAQLWSAHNEVHDPILNSWGEHVKGLLNLPDNEPAPTVPMEAPTTAPTIKPQIVNASAQCPCS